MQKAVEQRKNRGWDTSSALTQTLDLVFQPFKDPRTSEIPNACFTYEHLLNYFISCGLSAQDFATGAELNRTSVCLYVRRWDVYTWLLEIPPFEVCGQRLSVSIGQLRVSKKFFLDPHNQNTSRMSEKAFFEKFELRRQYLPLEKKKNVELNAMESKVYIWGEPFGYTPQIWKGAKGRTIVQAVCGDRHVVFLTDVGQIITTGDNLQGQCGTGTAETTVSERLVNMPSSVIIRQIAAGNTYTLALTESGNVFYWGRCAYSATEGPYNVPKRYVLFHTQTPTLWERLKRDAFTQIASGAAHMLFLRADQQVISVGSPDGGRLGRGGAHNLPAPILALKDCGVTQICCGYTNSMALCESTFKVYVWGRNDKLQCGIPHTFSNSDAINEPTAIRILDGIDVKEIASGFTSSYAITQKGQIYHWGMGEFGPTGPTLMNYFTQNNIPVAKIATGMQHTVALGAQGEVYTWGLSQIGQCGHGDTFTYKCPTRIYGLDGMSGISACGSISLAYTGLLRTPLSEDLQQCVNNPDSFPDLLIYVHNATEPIYAHRAMIFARCHKLQLAKEVAGFDPGLPANDRTAWIKSGAIPTKPCQDEVIHPVEMRYETTHSGNKRHVTPSALLTVLHYIYTDTIKGATADDAPIVLEICEDFGLRRLSNLLSAHSIASQRPSTYVKDLDSLIPTPSEFVPSTDAEKAWISKKQRLTSLQCAFSDLTISTTNADNAIYAHRFLMCRRSEYFQTQLTGAMLEAKTRHVTLTSDESTLKWLLIFLYTDKLYSDDINITVELLKLGAMLNLPRLVFLCSRAIEKVLDDETTLYMYHLATEHSIPALREICWSLMVINWTATTNTNYWKENLTDEEREKWTARAQTSIHQ